MFLDHDGGRQGWQRITPPASTHLGRLTYGQEVAGSTVVHLEPLDRELAVASHWVVMDSSILIYLVLVIGGLLLVRRWRGRGQGDDQDEN